eukprot:COSAG01_NODE_62878_length_282_cov_1.125683_1_plen_50_part_01
MTIRNHSRTLARSVITNAIVFHVITMAKQQKRGCHVHGNVSGFHHMQDDF